LKEVTATPPESSENLQSDAQASLLKRIESKEKELEADRERTSGLVSDRVRAVAAGVLALAWGFIIEPDFLPARQMVGPVALAFLTLLLDFLQYLIGYVDSSLRRRRLKQLRREMMIEDRNTAAAGSGTWPRRLRALRTTCFYGKIVTVMGALTWLITAMAAHVFSLEEDDASALLSH
jgi:hypothetical protein